jgi:hypothetical protein
MWRPRKPSSSVNYNCFQFAWDHKQSYAFIYRERLLFLLFLRIRQWNLLQLKNTAEIMILFTRLVGLPVLRIINSTQPAQDSTTEKTMTNIHSLSGIRVHDPSM